MTDKPKHTDRDGARQDEAELTEGDLDDVSGGLSAGLTESSLSKVTRTSSTRGQVIVIRAQVTPVKSQVVPVKDQVTPV